MPLKEAGRPKSNAQKSASSLTQQAVQIDLLFSETDDELIFQLPLDDCEPAKILAHIEYPDVVMIEYSGPDNTPHLLCSPPYLRTVVNIRSAKGRFENSLLTITFHKITYRNKSIPLSPGHGEHATQWHGPDHEPFPIPIDIVPPAPATIPAPQETEKRPMLDKTKGFVQDGIRYFPLSIAAPVVQAPPSTLLDWIKKEIKINGKPLQGYYFAPANRHFISEESIERAANRFIKWPSEEHAGPVTLGEKRDQTGYIHLSEAARTIGVHHHTLWRWTTRETTPTDKPLDVIKDPASDQLYIRQKDVSALKKLIPRGGLRAGRRSLPTLRPH